jgi:hypothetical protein
MLLNAWWILPFMRTSGYVSEQLSPSANIGTLLTISEHLGAPIHLIRLINIGFFKNIETVWSPIYSSTIFNAISFLIPIIVFSALLLKPEHRLVIYFTFLSTFGIFLAKGTAPPMGEIFLLVFTSFPAFQVFRNPFEKFGIIIPIGYAVLFGVGLSSIYYWIRKHVRISLLLNNSENVNVEKIAASGLIVLVCFSTLGIYAWPMWTGMVFTSGITPANNPDIGDYVDVPAYYREANLWVSDQQGNLRLIVLPIGGEGITYNWTYGYAGVELSNQLFDKPSISYTPSIPGVDDIVVKMEKTLLSTTQFWKVMALLNAKYIIVRDDINYIERNMRPPKEISRALNYTVVPNVINNMVNTSSTQVKRLNEDYNLQNWRPTWSTPGMTIKLDPNDTMQSTYSTVLNGTLFPSERDFVLSLLYDLPENEQDLSNTKYLLVWLKSSIPGVLWITMADHDGKNLQWYGTWEPIGWVGDSRYSISPQEVNLWKLIVLPLDVPIYVDKGKPNLDNIKQIGLTIRTDVNSTKLEYLKIGGLFTDTGKMITVEHINYVKSFGKLDFYKVDDEYFLERIHATNKFILVNDVDDMLFNLIPSDNFDPRDTMIFLRSQSTINNITFLESLKSEQLYQSQIAFEKIDPTKYMVKIENATNPFFLVFSETYHPQWKAYYGDVNWIYAFSADPILDNHHFIANGYANAWYINKTGTYTITLYFQPQSLLQLGTLISTTTLTITTTITLYFNRKKLKEKITLIKLNLTHQRKTKETFTNIRASKMFNEA